MIAWDDILVQAPVKRKEGESDADYDKRARASAAATPQINTTRLNLALQKLGQQNSVLDARYQRQYATYAKDQTRPHFQRVGKDTVTDAFAKFVCSRLLQKVWVGGHSLHNFLQFIVAVPHGIVVFHVGIFGRYTVLQWRPHRATFVDNSVNIFRPARVLLLCIGTHGAFQIRSIDEANAIVFTQRFLSARPASHVGSFCYGRVHLCNQLRVIARYGCLQNRGRALVATSYKGRPPFSKLDTYSAAIANEVFYGV